MTNNPLIKRAPTFFLKTVIVLIGIATLAWLLWFPQVEGRNADSSPISLYFNDPFLAYVYISSIAFFTALYQAFTVLGYIERDTIFSQASVKALRIMKYALTIFIGCVATAIVFVSIMGRLHNDDSTGAVALGLMVIFATSVVAVAAGVFQRMIQSRI